MCGSDARSNGAILTGGEGRWGWEKLVEKQRRR